MGILPTWLIVGYYDLSVLSMSVMGFQKKFGWGWVGGWGELYPVLFWIFGKQLTCKAPKSKRFHRFLASFVTYS